MLVVIAIIGILAGLITVAATAAVSRAKDVRIKSELDQLDMALKAFKQQYGAYPPCDLRIAAGNGSPYPNQNALVAFVMQAFPRYHINANSTLAATLQSDLANSGVDTNNFHPDRALVFWLSGFYPDVTMPIYSATPVGSRTPFFSFDTTRLWNMVASPATSGYTAPAPGNVDSIIGKCAYVPVGSTAPYVYFDSGIYANSISSNVITLPSTNAVIAPATPAHDTGNDLGAPALYAVTSTAGTDAGIATPYVLDVNNSGTYSVPPDTFCNPTTFQIISAGQDGQFGYSAASHPTVFREYPFGGGYDTTVNPGAENDNISNFLSGSVNLGDAMPN
jgi:type II secretory pathway pseudopilin PulG